MNNKIITTLFSLLHLVVDGLCSLIIFSRLYNNDYDTCLMIFLIYNFLAFLSQPLFGLFIDVKNYPRLFLILSVLFLLLGCLTSFNFVISSICLGIGNSIFHICGGKFVISKSHNDIVSLGLFVSFGAIGLALGQHFYSNTLLYIFISLLLVLSIIIVSLKDSKVNTSFEIDNIKINNKDKIIILILLLLTVFIRSFNGKILTFDFNKTKYVFLYISIFTALGKAFGGVLVKLIKVKYTIIISMILSIICFLFPSNLYLSLIGIFCFNITMPITLWYACRLFKNKEGFTFGLLAAFLIPGYLLGMLEYDRLLITIFMIISCIASLLFILYVERKLSYGHSK